LPSQLEGNIEESCLSRIASLACSLSSHVRLRYPCGAAGGQAHIHRRRHHPSPGQGPDRVCGFWCVSAHAKGTLYRERRGYGQRRRRGEGAHDGRPLTAFSLPGPSIWLKSPWSPVVSLVPAMHRPALRKLRFRLECNLARCGKTWRAFLCLIRSGFRLTREVNVQYSTLWPSNHDGLLKDLSNTFSLSCRARTHKGDLLHE
jgi:hypothetical protein